MTTLEKIQEVAAQLPEPLREEILHLMEDLLQRQQGDLDDDERRMWSAFSLAHAMRGIADDPEEVEYTLDDLKEIY